MDDAASVDERERRRAGLAWALADLDGLLARGVIGAEAHAALRGDYEARLAALATPIAPAPVPTAVAARAPDRPPPAPPPRAHRPAAPAGPSPTHDDISPTTGAGVAPPGAQPRAIEPEPVTGLWINLLLFVGAFFVVVAALIFVATQWASIGAATKAAIMGGFTLAFVAGGLLCVRLPRVRPAGQTFLAIGAILLPLDIAGGYNLLFRDQGFSAAATAAWGSLVCALFYGALALRGLGRVYAGAAIVATVCAWGGTLVALGVPDRWLAAAFAPLPLALLLSGRLAQRAAPGRATFGPLLAPAAHLLIPAIGPLLTLAWYERAAALGAACALALVAVFYGGAAASQPAAPFRALHVAGAWAAIGGAAFALGRWADIPARGYAAVALGVAWLALAAGAGLWRAGERWRAAALVTFAASGVHVAALLAPWGFFVRGWPVYWAAVFGGATLLVALYLWAFRQPPLLYPLALAAALALFHGLAIGPRPGPYGYAWAYALAALAPVAPLQPLRAGGASRAWDRQLVVIGQLLAIGAALTAQWVGDPFQAAAIPVLALLMSGLVVWFERRPELLILPNLWGLVATAALVRLAGAGPRWAPACYAAVGLVLALGLQGWRNTPADWRGGWFVAHRLAAGGWAVAGPLLALVGLAPALSGFLATGDLGALVITHPYGPAGLAVVLCGAAFAADAVATLRRPTGYSASAMVALAILMGIARITPDTPQAYALPLGLYLLALSVYVAYERDLGPARMPTANGLLSGAVVVILGTTFLQALAHPWRYLLPGLVESLLILGATAFLRRRYGVALALLFITLFALRALFDAARALPNWATFGLLGLALLAAGVLFLLRRDRLEAWGGAARRRWTELT